MSDNWVNLITPINKYVILGVFLFIVGLILIPFIIGIPIALAGWLLMSFGFFYHYFKKIPGNEKVSEQVINSFKYAGSFFKNIVKEAFKK